MEKHKKVEAVQDSLGAAQNHLGLAEDAVVELLDDPTPANKKLAARRMRDVVAALKTAEKRLENI